jgi:ribonucleoside-diphosphate reductase beta chain
MNILDITKKTPSNKLFFGEDDKIIRVDSINHSELKKLKEKSEGNTWFTKEVHYDSDRIRFAEIQDESAQRQFFLNIGYQTVMDSGASNGYLDVVRPICTDKISKMGYSRIGIEEMIHAESYSYGLEQIFGEKAEGKLDIIYTDSYIQNRMKNEIDAFSEVQKLTQEVWSGRVHPESDEVKIAILRMIMLAYLLEGIKFPHSFYVTFNLNRQYDNAIQGLAKLIKLIAHDEFEFHVPFNLHIMKILKKDPSQGYQHLFEKGWFADNLRMEAKRVQDDELEWSSYMRKLGDTPGYNEKISDHFIRYWTNHRLRGAKVDVLEDIRSNDTIQWYNIYKDINKTNSAAQETDNIGYQKAGLVNDLGSEKW